MLEVKLTNKFDDLFQLDVVQVSERTCLFLCPNPTIADGIRSHLEKRGLTHVEVLTIHKFIRDESLALEVEANILSKSQMLMRLAKVWKENKEEYNFQEFYQAYNLFSELRSVSLDIELMSEIFPHYDLSIVQGVFWFWKELVVADICDEHAFYEKLDEKLKLSEEEEGRHIVFYGFDFVTGVQIDWLKSLSLQNRVVIPFPEKVYQKTTDFDWIRWFSADQIEEKEYSKGKKIKVCKYPKGRMTYFTKNLEEAAGNRNLKFILSTRTPTFSEVNEIAETPLFFKLGSDLFSAHLQGAFEEIKNKYFIDREAIVSSEELLEYIKSEMRTELKKAVTDKNFRKIKVYDLLKKSIEEYDEEEYGYFDIEILENTCELDLPRTSSMPVATCFKGEVGGLNSVGSVKEDDFAIVCASSQYNKLKGSDNFYSEEVMEFLSSVGPIKRKEFEFEILKTKLTEVLENDNAILLIENGLTDHDIAWSDIVESFDEVEEVSLSYTPGKEVSEDFVQSQIDKKERTDAKMSATRLQTYLDCPRKYYFQYVDKAKFFPELTLDIPPNEKGQMQHDIIGTFVQNHNEFKADEHEKLCKEKFDHHLVKYKKKIAQILYDSVLHELIQYTKNGIVELNKLRSVITEIDYKFEEEMIEVFNGSCDLIFKMRDGKIGIIDFKRSKGSIPSITDVRELKKIQLPFYVKGMEVNPSDIEILGYMNLSDPKDSVIFCFDGVKKELIKNSKFCGGKVSNLKEEIEKLCSDFDGFYDEKYKEILSQVKFPALPQSDKSCTYCELKPICNRGVEVGN